MSERFLGREVIATFSFFYIIQHPVHNRFNLKQLYHIINTQIKVLCKWIVILIQLLILYISDFIFEIPRSVKNCTLQNT